MSIGKRGEKWVAKDIKISTKTLKYLSFIKHSQTIPAFSYFYKRNRKSYRKVLLAVKKAHNSKLAVTAENRKKAV